MNDVKKHHLRMTADIMSKELYSKKCAKLDCDDCPAHIPANFVESETENGTPQLDIYCVCLRTILKRFMSNLKDA